MLEHKQLARRHQASRGAAIVLEHVHKGREKQVEILLREAGLLGQRCRNEPFYPIEPIGNVLLAPHGALFLGVLLLGDSHAGNAHFHWHDRIDRFRKTHLYGPAHLPAVNARGHHGPEATNVEEVVAHELRDFQPILLALRKLLLRRLHIVVNIGLFVALV